MPIFKINCLVSVNLQRRPNAAARLAALPLVASARTKLSVVYSGHPSLRCVCEGLERCVTVVLSPVVDKLQPQGEYWHTRLDMAFKSGVTKIFGPFPGGWLDEFWKVSSL